MKHASAAVLVLALPFAACGHHDDHVHAPGDGHVHPDDPKPAATGDAHGAPTALGTQTIGGLAVEATREGPVEPGKEVGLDLTFPAGAALPGAVRAWVGIESSVGSSKCRLAKESERVLHGHLEVPKPLLEGSAIWIEVEMPTGLVRASIPLAR